VENFSAAQWVKFGDTGRQILTTRQQFRRPVYTYFGPCTNGCLDCRCCLSSVVVRAAWDGAGVPAPKRGMQKSVHLFCNEIQQAWCLPRPADCLKVWDGWRYPVTIVLRRRWTNHFGQWWANNSALGPLQARNQLGTLWGSKSFLKGPKFLNYVQHVFPGGHTFFQISGKREISSLILISWVNSCSDSLLADMVLTLHKSQVHCFGNMQLWACSSIDPPLPAEASCETKERIVLLLTFVANNIMATNLRRFTSSHGGRRFPACNYWTQAS